MEILERVKSLQLPMGTYAVFGSGLLGVYSMRPTKDIDLVVIEELYNKLKNEGWDERESANGVVCLTLDEFEIFKNWEFDNYHPDVAQLIADADIIDNVPFVRLEEVLKWKKAYGREKDLIDIQLIEHYLAQQK